ncbi:chloramphenicol phosphotransferase CPT [Kitasatospora sp. NPDC051914]|uniref:chloramphenicol phosphotransferase CPT n=1 Tax=Kitasatospora sp. NPDC051914 TaxID=3154945 RepID=UPI00343C9975
MTVHVIVLNGGSSSGKSSLARSLQETLPEPWLTFGVDTLIDAMPPALVDGPGSGIDVADDGSIAVGDTFRQLDTAWSLGIAAMARAGTRIVVDDVFLGGPASQERWRTALAGLDVLWVGVHCAPEVAAAREAVRGDRTPGMAAIQALAVHHGITYDLEIDTATTDPTACARLIADRLDRRGRSSGPGGPQTTAAR